MGHLQLLPGSLFANRFDIDRPVGRGGMGTVYRARDRYSGDVVAIKLMHAETHNGEDSERFTREAQLLSELCHPGIVAHIAHGQAADGQRFLAMEWLDGEDLGQRLERGPLSLCDCQSLLECVAAALCVAHGQGIIHRDIKPTNLFLVDGSPQRTKLLDFGIARRAVSSRALTRTNGIVGTPGYMAPEQARAARELTPAADMFSLGCVLYECLTGEPPFVAEHIAAVLVRILHDVPVPVAQRRPGVPAAMAQLVECLLAKDPTQRLADAAVLLGQLATLGVLPQSGIAITGARPRPQPTGFGQQEQSLLSIVLAATPEQAMAADASLLRSGVLPDSDRQALIQALRDVGLVADYLANGAVVVIGPPTGSATDQAAQAARGALLIKARWPKAVVSMATGPGIIQGHTVLGEVVDDAARALKSAGQTSPSNDAGGVLLDSLSASLLAGRFVQTPLPSGALLVGEEPEADVSRPLLGRPTPCVGREAELNNLDGQLTACIEDREARVVFLTGAPGVGKSRLRHEFLRRVEKRSEPITLLLGRASQMSAGTPYGMLAGAIRGLCGLSGSEPLPERRQRLQDRIWTNVSAGERVRVAAFLGELCNIPFQADGNPMLQAARQEPKLMREALRRAWLDWLAAECAAAPVLVALDDLQWGDELTVQAVDEALRELRDSPLLVVGFARPEIYEIFPKLWSKRRLHESPLKGLSRRACERLVRQVLADIAPESVAWAVEHSGGNALFLEELIRSIAAGRQGNKPETVVAMLQARIAKLDAGARRAVRAAAVYGQTFWQRGVSAILGEASPISDVDTWLASLVDAEIVQLRTKSRLANDQEYGFRHALVRDAAYGLLGASDLAVGHHLAAEFLQAAGENDAAAIAEHLELSGDKPRAARCYLQAAEDNLERGSLRGGLHNVERGLACGPDAELQGLLRSAESYLTLYLNQPQAAAQAANAAIEQLRDGCLGWCRAMGPAIVAAVNSQDLARGFALVSRLLATEPAPLARAIYSETLMLVLAILVVAAPAKVLQTVLQRLADTACQAESTNPTLRRYHSMALAVMSTFRDRGPWTLVKEAERAVSLAEQAGDFTLSLKIRGMNLEWGWLDLGDVDGARQRLSALAAEIDRHENVALVINWRHLLARVLCSTPRETDWEQAAQLVAPMLTDPGGHAALLILMQEAMARVALLRGQLQEVEVQTRALMQFLPVLPILVAHTAPTRIRALLGLGRFGEATEVANQLLAVIPVTGGLGVAEVELRLAASEAFRAAGDDQRARAELQATLRHIQLRADDILDPFWRNSYLTRNRSCARAQSLAKEWGIA